MVNNIEFASFNFSEDIQEPKIIEDKRGGFIKYGKDNLYPDFLVDLFLNKSTKHKAVLDRKVRMISGQGFEDTTGLEDFINNNYGTHNLEDLSKLITADYEVFNYFAFIVRWNADKTRINALDYVPASKIRKGLNRGSWFVSDDWKNHKKASSNTVEYCEINKELPANINELSREEKQYYLNQIVVFTELSIGSDSYPAPYYQPAINYILADNEIGKFNYNNIRNNFVGGYQIDFNNGIPKPEERAQVKRNFLKEYTGNDSSNVIMTFNEPDSKGTKITPLPTNGSEDAFINVENRVQENIFIAHGVTNPQLFGVRVAGSLGGKDELIESLEIFNATNIRPRQENIENVLNKVLQINYPNKELRFKEYTIVDNVINKDNIIDGENVAATAMNGAQISSMLEIVSQISIGAIDKESGLAIIESGFPSVSTEQAKKIIGLTKI